MLSKIKKLSIYWLVPVLLIFMASCTNVDESLPSDVTPDQFFQNDQQFIAALGDAYSTLGTGVGGAPGFGGHNGYTSIQEVASDEALIPHRGPDWFDGGVWLRTHRHTFQTDETAINNAWVFLFGGVNSANRLITQFNTLVEDGSVDQAQADDFIAELEVLRAFYYLHLLDTFGNVPIIDSFDVPENPSNNSNFQAGRTELFNFIETSVLNNIDKVSTSVGTTYGRVNKFVAHMILAKLYMNAEVYTGTARWDDAIAQLDAVAGGGYSLADSYSLNFVTENSGSPEIIFAIPYDNVNLTGFNLAQMTLHYQQQSTFQLDEQPWNGYASMGEFYNSHIDPDINPGPQGDVIGLDGQDTTGTLDERRNNFSAGLQRSFTGDPIEDASFATTNDESDEARGTVDESPVVVLTPRLDEIQPNANRQSGARIVKYEIEPGALSNLNNDFVLYRYADVLLLKAEALMRSTNNENNQQALELVNQVRERAGVDPFQTLTYEKLLAERGREMFYEVVRRQDLIRFDGQQAETAFNDPWRFKNQSPTTANVFPIPQDQIEANPNLNQNPGF